MHGGMARRPRGRLWPKRRVGKSEASRGVHTGSVPIPDPARLLDDLNDAQREAVLATEGPVGILAGAGSGKTRVISRRAAYAIATEVVPADQVLIVTFTEKAATEMMERLRGLGLPGVTARTFHAACAQPVAPFLAAPP